MTETKADNPDQAADEFNFTSDKISDSTPTTLKIGGEYDARPQEDSARRTIAYLLIGLLWLVVVGMLILLGFGSIAVTDIKEFGYVIGPVVALVSAATGFYYGTKSNSATKS